MKMKSLLLRSLAITFFLLPFEKARTLFFGAPVYLVEIGVLASITIFFLQRQGNSIRIKRCLPFQMGIAALLLGVLSSIFVAAFSPAAPCPLSSEELWRGLGIFKSWFVFPILFGWMLLYASHLYFSREKFIFVFLVSFLPISILSLLGLVFGSGTTYDGRLQGSFNSPNALAMYLAPAIILSWYFLRSHDSRSQCFMFHVLCFMLLSSLLFLTHSISAWIAVAVSIFFFEYPAWIVRVRIRANDYSPVRLRYIIMSLAFSGILVFSQWNNSRFEHFFDTGSRSSFASRVMIWKSAGKMTADSPIFGIGPGNFGGCYLAYQKYFPPYLEWSVPEPHNIFLAFWLGSGLLGLLAFCFLIGWWFRTLFLALKTTKKEHQQILLAPMAIMLAIIIHGLFDTPYWRLSLSYIFWIVFFLGISLSSSPQTEQLRHSSPRK